MFDNFSGVDVILISIGLLATFLLTSLVIALLFDDEKEKR